MLDPSSSEEESDEVLEEERRDVLVAAGGGSSRSLPPPPRDPRARDAGAARAASPSPSVLSEGREEQERLQREERENRLRLQLYVFIVRCIAHPFNAKQPTDMARRQQKLNKQQLQILKERFQAFLNGETQIVADEAFCNAVRSYYEVFLKSDRVARMVHSGGCSANDFRDVFKKNIEKRVRSLPEIDGLSKETVLSSWLAKYDAIYRGEEDFCKQPNRMALSAVSELILSKEQLYEMFQQILGIKKLEHQLIYNACQVSIGVTRFCCIRNLSPHPGSRASSVCAEALNTRDSFSAKLISTHGGDETPQEGIFVSFGHWRGLGKGDARIFDTYAPEIY